MMPNPPQQQQRPTPSTDILWKSAQGRIPPGMSQGRYFGGLQALMKKSGAKLFQIGNTVFLLTFQSPGVVQFHMASQEPVQQIVQHLRAGAQYMKKLGAKKVFAITPDAGYARIARMTGLPVKVTRDPQGYRLELDL